ncbi:hypothetical protein LJC54_09310 [Parabacteroides sp. OttesenSCG-928-J18]|nr:hypothetical protein [Parabacteroides sp. OttesenSCG-928-J18]
MAVTKIRKMSSWTLIVSVVISVAVLLAFFLGGVVDPAAEMKEPIYTGMLLNWIYIIFAITAVSTLLFAVWQFIGMFKTNPKGAMMGLGALVLFAGLMIVCYMIGDGTPLPLVSADTAKYNIPMWLKVTDMWIYSIYALVALLVIAILWGSLRKIFGK